MKKLNNLNELKTLAETIRSERRKRRVMRIMVHMGTCGLAAGAQPVLEAMRQEVVHLDLEEQVFVDPAGCAGLCYAEPTVAVIHSDGRIEYYGNVDVQQGRIIVNRCLTQSPILGLHQIEPGWTADVSEGEDS